MTAWDSEGGRGGDDVLAAAKPVGPLLDTEIHGGGGAAIVAPTRGRVRQYELIREIGHGGMGTVYLARDTKLARLVAIKFLSKISPGFSERFLVEARATARCSHENIVVIHEIDELEGQPYMVLEYLEGKTLRDLLNAGRLSPARAIELITPVVRALAHAHASSIVHRDLKPENIFVTRAGQVKVLDFGIAKSFEDDALGAIEADDDADTSLTGGAGLMGTVPYMSPEQWGADEVDHRTDIWATGLLLFEMISGHHPLSPISRDALMTAATRLDTPMPALQSAVPEAPTPLAGVVARCLEKRKARRYADADELLADLEELAPRPRRSSGREKNPYPGLSAFREEDADVFYGRDAEIARMRTRLRDRPLLGIVGPSGAGKSSFVRAGLIPELKRGEAWEVAVTRPGRSPLQALSATIVNLGQPATEDVGANDESRELASRSRSEPGVLGERLRTRARQTGSRVLLFVDQFEELYTLTHDDALRDAYLASLLGAADDPLSPVRVVLSMRSDFLDRVANTPSFLDALTPGLLFLAPPRSEELRSALERPAAYAGYSFEDPAIVDDMLEQLADTAGALPLMQFAVGKLWEERDTDRRILTKGAYDDIGGVTGALASHADAVVAGLAPNTKAACRRLFERLVTPDRTRDVVPLYDLLEDSRESADQVRALIDLLVGERLLVMHAGADSPRVEIVHEKLIEGWPTLRRWLDQNQEDAAFLGRLRTVAKQWSDAGRPDGLLWRDAAASEARRWREQYTGELGSREEAYLGGAFRMADRAARRKRTALFGTIAALTVLVIAAAVALVWIRNAEQAARRAAAAAEEGTERARDANAKLGSANEELEARAAELEAERGRIAGLLTDLQAEIAAKDEAQREVVEANENVAQSRDELERANAALREALARAQSESERATRAANEARASAERAEVERARAETLARQAESRADRLEKQRGTLSSKLK